jgi:hypothetical protein
MHETEYYDFHLALEVDERGACMSRILRSLEGRAVVRFEPPPATAGGDGTSWRQDAEVRGKALFDALFAGAVGDKLRACLKRLDGGRDGRRRGLRLRLAIDPDAAELASLADIDWEQMFDAESSRFLSRSPQTTLVRDLEVPTVLLDLPGARPLRILVVGAQPTGWAALDFEGEVARIRQAWEGCDVAVEPMPRATFRDLRSRLRRGDAVHVLHFIGHGEVDESEVSGVLLFEQPGGAEHRVTSERLAELFHQDPNLRLVVLNACETSVGPERFPSRSVAAQLMKAGVPAVVAMRYKVPDSSAVAFSDGFYQALAHGLQVDAAVTAARLEIDDTEELFWHWATPALFMSSLDGRIFQFTEAHSDDAGEPKASRVPKRLGIRTRYHPYRNLEGDCDHILDLAPLFEGRLIRDPVHWQDKVEPYLDYFFRQHVSLRRPLTLQIDAHLTVGFAAGRAIDTRGVEVTIRQATMGGFHDWRMDPSMRYEGPGWNEESVDLEGASGHDLAIAVGITNGNLEDVRRSLREHSIEEVGRILAVTPDPAPGNTAIRDANHAFALAEELKRRISARSAAEQEGTLHIFFAGPGAFAFYLGQLSRGFGEIQLYEWEFENRGTKVYDPSLRIVPEDGGRR